MKKFFLLVPLTLLALCTSCTQDDDAGNPESEFTATYFLTNGSGSIAGGNFNFEPGLISWSFDSENHTVTIVNNNPDPMAYGGPDSGIYPFSIGDSELPEMCEHVLIVDGVDYGCYTITANGLTLTNTYADGYTYTFTTNAIQPF